MYLGITSVVRATRIEEHPCSDVLRAKIKMGAFDNAATDILTVGQSE